MLRLEGVHTGMDASWMSNMEGGNGQCLKSAAKGLHVKTMQHPVA